MKALITFELYYINQNTSFYVLINNPDRIEGAFKTTEVAKLLTNHGWKINTVWVPSHCDIEGNESADKLVKLGTDHTDMLSNVIYLLCVDEPDSTMYICNSMATGNWYA
jgi:hypothetical protein